MKIVARCALSAAICAAGGVSAANFTWQGASGARWNEKSSYVEDAVPAAGDTVTVPDGYSPVVGDDDFALVSALRDVELDKNCSITFSIATDRTLNCSVHQPDSDISSYSRSVKVVKEGAGKLTLAAPAVAGAVSNPVYLYRVSWQIDGGSIAFADNLYNSMTLSMIRVDVAEGALFDIGNCDRVNIARLFGAGTVTNGATASTMLYIQRENHTSEFSGRITGNIEFRATSNGSSIALTGTESDFAAFATYGLGTAYIKKFGNAGEPSSIGTNGTMQVLQNGGRLVYTGAGGETCDKAVGFSNSYSPVTLDGGATGGIEFSGMFGNYSGQPRQRRFVFDGSNRTECVFSGQYVERDRNGTNYSTFITKKGTGIWRFANNSKRSNLGVVAVDEGTLRYDSLAEAGTVCSLGKATELYDDIDGYPRLDEWVVPYALRVGGGGTEGIFEYTGAENVKCSTRPLAVQGNGRLRNATGCDFEFSNVFGIGDGAKTLTLDGGSATAYNRLDTVTNACGTLSIAKDGDGTWILAGEQSFNGMVDVRRGTLKVLREPTHTTWFKLIVKQSYHLTLADAELVSKSASTSREFQMQELAFYDADGIRRNLGITLDDSTTDLTTLSTGKVAYISGRTGNNAARGPGCLFDDVFTSTGWHGVSPATGSTYLITNVPASWVQLVMRLPDETPEIVAYDFAHATAPNNSRQVYAYAIEGSSDGVHWTELTNVVGAAATDQYKWNSNNGTPTAGETLEAGRGFPINTHLRDSAPVFNNVTSVAVAPGATLVADIRDGGAPIELRGITADPSATGEPGVIDGFAFAEHGTLNLTSATDGASVLPLRLENATGVANIAGWDVEYNGVPTTRFRVSADPAAGTLTVTPTGIRVIVR